MKKLKFTSLAFLLGLVVLTNCKDPAAPEPTAEEKQTALLAQNWKVGTAANDVTLKGTDEIGNWAGFTVTYNANGSYTTTNVSEGREGVWPSTGSWAYQNAGTADVDVNTLIRDAGSNNETIVKITVSETTLKMTFDYTDPTGRTSGTEGSWVFIMDK